MSLLHISTRIDSLQKYRILGRKSFFLGFEGIAHCLLASSTAVQKPEATLSPGPLFACDCFLFVETWRICSLSCVLKFHTDILWCDFTTHLCWALGGPSDLEVSLWDLQNYSVHKSAPPLSLFALWNSHYLEIGPSGLFLNLMLFPTIFISICSTLSAFLSTKWERRQSVCTHSFNLPFSSMVFHPQMCLVSPNPETIFFFFLLTMLHGMWDISSLTRDRTRTVCIESAKS